MKKWMGVLFLLFLLTTACTKQESCPPAPQFTVLVAGTPVGGERMSGNGFYCNTIGDGVTAAVLEPVDAEPRAEVSLRYEPGARWETITFAISVQGIVVNHGEVPAQRLSFTLPQQPAIYAVSMEGKSQHGQLNTYFRVKISGAEETGSIPEPTAYLYPTVPVYPLASKHSLLSHGRGSIQIKEKSAAQILAWYAAELPGAGWKAVPISLPADKVVLFARNGEYLSVSGHDVFSSQGVMVWFHLRSTPEVTREAATEIARSAHRAGGEWTPTLLPEFQSERYGNGVKHPVWLVEASPGNDAVWVDAITAEAIRIRQ